jgi:hypothetical protein
VPEKAMFNLLISTQASRHSTFDDAVDVDDLRDYFDQMEI